MEKPKEEASLPRLVLCFVGLVILLLLCCFALMKSGQRQIEKAAEQLMENART